jgi:hypothetical protein
MKNLILFAVLLFSVSAFAQTKKEKKIKDNMLTRLDKITSHLEVAKDSFSKEVTDKGCSELKKAFALMPDHLKDIGTHMDLFQSKTIKSKNEALNQLIYLHRQTNVCDQGVEQENIDSKVVKKELKKILKSLKKQRKAIKKGDTGYENSFYYYYEF